MAGGVTLLIQATENPAKTRRGMNVNGADWDRTGNPLLAKPLTWCMNTNIPY
jgi:hypothetical protein